MRGRPKTTDYYLGSLIGELIYYLYLPTLSVDCLKTRNVVEVSEDERIECDRLNQILSDTYSDDTPKGPLGHRKTSEIAHANWIAYVHELGRKHLPEKLTCRFTKIEFKEIDDFFDGLEEYLWDTDLSWYMPNKDDFWVKTSEHAWFSEVILTRTK
jgi:hypothetical protein